jgi:fumarylpyruvate hydrolase
VPGGGVPPFPSAARDLHHDVDLVVAIGRPGKIAAKEAAGLVYGYAFGLEITRPELLNEAKRLARLRELARGFAKSCPISAIAPAAHFGHPASGRISLGPNGDLHQTGDLADTTRTVEEASHVYPITSPSLRGDLIVTDTLRGVGKVLPGSVLAGYCDGVEEIGISYAAA